MIVDEFPRLRSLTAGRAMVVTDLHGDWEIYERYRDRFLDLHSTGEADFLIFTGDLIHLEVDFIDDRSLDIVLDVMRLSGEMQGKIICLLGNHEFPHIYGVSIRKGEKVFTPSFEAAMGSERENILKFFKQLPFFVRTKAGVSISHAGAAMVFIKPGIAENLFKFSHQALLDKVRKNLKPAEIETWKSIIENQTNRHYNDLVAENLAVTSPSDPRYHDLIIGTIASTNYLEYQWLWEVSFNKNEFQYGEDRYSAYLEMMLQELSKDFYSQIALVSGHIKCSGGFHIVAGRQLRIASGTHALPYHSARYLLFDVGEAIGSMDNLKKNLQSVF